MLQCFVLYFRKCKGYVDTSFRATVKHSKVCSHLTFFNECALLPSLLLPANEVWGKVMFLDMSVVLFTEGGVLNDVTACLTARSMLLLRGISVAGPMFLPGKVSVQGVSREIPPPESEK